MDSNNRFPPIPKEDSSSFIRKIDSTQIRYYHKKDKPKILRQYILGRSLGSGV
jgi:hypothetical protein